MEGTERTRKVELIFGRPSHRLERDAILYNGNRVGVRGIREVERVASLIDSQSEVIGGC